MPTGGQAANVWQSGGAGREALESIWQSDGSGRSALRGAQDGLQSTQIEHRLERSLNDFFNGRLGPARPGATKSINRIDLDQYWNEDGFRSDASRAPTCAYSRRLFSYPQLAIYTKLPTVSPDAEYYIGFENGSYHLSPLFDIRSINGAFEISAGAGTVEVLDITNLLPADYDTAYHRYQLKVNKCNFEVYIDDVLRGIILTGVPETIPDWENSEPYALGSIPVGIMNCELSAFIEIVSNDLLLPLHSDRNSFVASSGPPLAPRQYAVYNENTSTKWLNLATGGDLQTSHPIPVWGYPRKTLHFSSSAAGTLYIDYYAGGAWRNYDTPTLPLSGDTYIFPQEFQTPIIRLRYDPTNNDTINFAVVHLA